MMMTKKKYNFKGFTKEAFLHICRALQQDLGLVKFSQIARNVANSYVGLTKSERYKLYSCMVDMYRSCKRQDGNWREFLARKKAFIAVLSCSRKVMSSKALREKRKHTRELLNDDKYIFYLCSKHYHPAEDHKDLQGKIYVDRFWRKKVSDEDAKKIKSYIRNHNVLAVQEIVGSPSYLTTRPYCKHYFIELDTETVLSTSLNKLVKLYGTHRDVLFDDKEKNKLHQKILSKLNTVEPCEFFQK